MGWLWKRIQNKIKREERQQRCFLVLNTILWTVSALVISSLFTVLFLPDVWKALEYSLIAAGYSGVFIGFLGGCIFLMRNTPE